MRSNGPVRDGVVSREMLRTPQGMRIDLLGYQVWKDGDAVALTRREGQLLQCLASKPGAVFPRNELAILVCGNGEAWGRRTLDVYISRLRNKLADPEGDVIQTIRKVGYRLSEAVIRESDGTTGGFP